MSQEVCTSCMKPIKPGQEWCQTPQCNTDLRDSNNRIPIQFIQRVEYNPAYQRDPDEQR